MPDLVLERLSDGTLQGVSEKDQRAWERFRSKLREWTGSFRFSYRFPRSGPFHRRHFAMLGALFEQQEQFDDFEVFRQWGQIGAGYCIVVPGPKGRAIAVSKSINYDALDQAEFEDVHNAVFAFYRSLHATRFLWAHLSDADASALVEATLQEFY